MGGFLGNVRQPLGLIILTPVVGTQGVQEGLEVSRFAEVAIDRGEAHIGKSAADGMTGISSADARSPSPISLSRA